MKFNKYIYIASLIFLLSFSNSSYAENQSDIQNIIFDKNSYNSNTSADIIFLSDQSSPQVHSVSSDTKKDIDDIVEKALIKASKEEEKRISYEKEKNRKKEEEKKREEDRKKEEYYKEKIAKETLSLNDILPTKTTDENLTKSGKIDFSDNSQITDYAKSLLGVPYIYGGNTLSGMDCSSYVQNVYGKFKIKLPRTTFDQIKSGKSVDFSDLKENDLIFFDTRSKQALLKDSKPIQNINFEDIKINESDVSKNNVKLYPTQPTHVGIYLGNGKFAHASSSKKKVVIEDISSNYFSNRIVDIKRYI